MNTQITLQKCLACGHDLDFVWYMDIKFGYAYGHKGFNCSSCGSTFPYEVIPHFPEMGLMNVGADEEYEDFRFPRACPFCKKAMHGILIAKAENPHFLKFNNWECFNCECTFDKKVMPKLKDHKSKDGWQRITPEEKERERLFGV